MLSKVANTRAQNIILFPLYLQSVLHPLSSLSHAIIIGPMQFTLHGMKDHGKGAWAI